MTDPHEWFSISDAASRLGVSRQYAHKLITSNPSQFSTARVGLKALIVRVADVDKYKEVRDESPRSDSGEKSSTQNLH